MIDEETKEKLLKEVEKSGNVYLSCIKVGVDKATYYRWKKEDKKFSGKAKVAEKFGRENNCDIAEHALMLNVRDKKMDAIKYVLSHNSPKYKEKHTSNVIIFHKKEAPRVVHQKTFENLLNENEKSAYEYGLELKERFTMFGGIIPKKPNGSEISIEELPNYETYITDWQRHLDSKINSERTKNGLPSTGIIPHHPIDEKIIENFATDTEDSKSETDKQIEAPKEN